MNVNEMIAGSLQGNLDMLKMTLADFTDADLLVRPVPAANHTAWQLGHLVAAENGMLRGAGAPMPELPAGFSDRFNGKTTAVDDAAKLGTKAELLGLLEKTRQATITWAKGMTQQQLDAPAPEAMRRFAPTVGMLCLMNCSHIMMHMGQIQVIRRKLGKPILF